MNQSILILIHRTVNDVADGLIKVFIPLVVYQTAGTVDAVLLYALAYYGFQSLFNLLLGKFFVRRPRIFILIRILPVLAVQILLHSPDMGGSGFLILLALGTSLANAFYWVPLNYLFASSAGGNLGKSVARFRSASLVSKVAMPVLGGLLISAGSIQSVIYTATGVYLVSVLILLSGFFRHSVPALETAGVPQTLTKEKYGRFFSAYLLTGLCDTAEMLWPLFVYIQTWQYVDAGAVASLVQLGMIGANLWAGKLQDKGLWRRPAIAAVAVFALVWMVRPYLTGAWSLYLLSSLLGFASVFINLPIFSDFILASRTGGVLGRNLMLREVFIKSGGAVSLAGALLSGSLIFSFFLAGVGTLGYLGIILRSRAAASSLTGPEKG